MQNHKNFSFDVGIASLGIAVNDGGEIIHGDVLLMHQEAGGIKEQSARRRMLRTREAHKAREAALESLWKSIGKEPLQRKSFQKTADGKFVKTKADERLEREFPRTDDDTVYASSLLRIMLLEGQKLEDWQIYKALHAGIQRRGYDNDVPWKAREEENKKKSIAKDENPEVQIDNFKSALDKMTPDKNYRLPCYYDAWKMGLWDSQRKKIICIRQPKRSKKPKEDRARGYNPSREMVDVEIRRLLEQAAKQIPVLEQYLPGDKINHLLYGTPHNRKELRYPSTSRIDGLLGQKYPRFENRIVSKCALIPRLNVCKSEKKLAIEVGFLLRLVNWRYEKEEQEKIAAALPAEELINTFKTCEANWAKKDKEYNAEEYAKCFKLTKSKLAKIAERLSGELKFGHEVIEASRHTGRSRFSQPALYLMKSLILSNRTPAGYYEELSKLISAAEKKSPNAKFGYQILPGVPYKYTPGDFEFLKTMGDSRESIYVPDTSLAERYRAQDGDADSAVQRIISTSNWPEVRHRLNIFDRELRNLTGQYGKPDAVHLEFVREDFVGEKKKREYEKQSKDGRERHQKAREELKNLNLERSSKNIMRYRLYDEQNHHCPYTGDAIDPTKLDRYDIDHIFPESAGGPDAYYNKVLTTADVNRTQKINHLPCECSFIKDWAAFANRLKNMGLGKNKKKLLLASSKEEAEALIDKYTGLSATAYIARLARDIVCVRFGWQPGAKDEHQRVFVFSGGLTSKVAKEYKLYQALGDGSNKRIKDRSDHRHHALDAMVISYLRQWARDKNKTGFFKLPDGVNAEYFAEKLADVHPRYVTRAKPALAEQPKPYRKDGKNKMSITEFKNISKDPDERGQWYTNKTETGKGTSQHGYIFYKNAEGEICNKTVHSFRSPYSVRKELEKKGNTIIELFRQKESIRLPSQNRITATQLGRNARLDFGRYEIIKVAKQEVVIGAAEQPQDDELKKYRISPDDLKKIKVCSELISGKTFSLDSFSVDKETNLTGNYKINADKFVHKNMHITNTDTGEMAEVGFDKLIRHLKDNNWLSEIKQKDIVEIDWKHLGYIKNIKADDLPAQDLPDGRYLIKGFAGGGKKVELISQNGTVYRMNSKILGQAQKTN